MKKEQFLFLFQNGYIDSDGSENMKVICDAAKKEAEEFAGRVIRKFDNFEEVLFFVRFPALIWMLDENGMFARFYSKIHESVFETGTNNHFKEMEKYMTAEMYNHYGAVFIGCYLTEMLHFFYEADAEEYIVMLLMEGIANGIWRRGCGE